MSFANGVGDYDPPPLLRSPEVAATCRFLGPTLTPAEVAAYEEQLRAGGIPCRHCDGRIPGRHCSHDEAGPFTRVAGRCTACGFWRPSEPDPAGGGAPAAATSPRSA
jgi:hypothetical protein